MPPIHEDVGYLRCTRAFQRNFELVLAPSSGRSVGAIVVGTKLKPEPGPEDANDEIRFCRTYDLILKACGGCVVLVLPSDEIEMDAPIVDCFDTLKNALRRLALTQYITG